MSSTSGSNGSWYRSLWVSSSYPFLLLILEFHCVFFAFRSPTTIVLLSLSNNWLRSLFIVSFDCGMWAEMIVIWLLLCIVIFIAVCSIWSVAKLGMCLCSMFFLIMTAVPPPRPSNLSVRYIAKLGSVNLMCGFRKVSCNRITSGSFSFIQNSCFLLILLFVFQGKILIDSNFLFLLNVIELGGGHYLGNCCSGGL